MTATVKELIRTYDATAERRQMQEWSGRAVDLFRQHIAARDGVTDRLRVDITGPAGSGKTLLTALIRAVFDPKAGHDDVECIMQHLQTIEAPVVYDDGEPLGYHPDEMATPLQMLRNFVAQFEDGSAGCNMDHEAAQLLAQSIKQGLTALDETYRTMFLMKHRRLPTDEEMGR